MLNIVQADYSGCSAPALICQPVLGPQALNPLELSQVTGYHHQAPTSGMACDHEIVSADWQAATFEGGTDVRRVGSGLAIVWQDIEASREALHCLPTPDWLGRPFSTIEQFVEDDIRDAEAADLGIEPVPQPDGSVPDNANAEIGR